MFIESVRLPANVPDRWPFTMEPVRHLAEHGLTFDRPITFLVGENGSGKSTVIEALADAVKINSEGGKAGTRYSSTGEPTALGRILSTELTSAGLRLIAGPRRKKHGFFLRAETLFNLARNVSGLPGFWGADLEQQSHGEGCFTGFVSMVSNPGLYLFDEPEAALSFISCLRLVDFLHELGQSGSQVICATHSPIIASTPGAEIIELGSHGLRRTAWEDLEIVDHWRRYLSDPQSYLHHFITTS
ncbi:MAG: AAA family ATPase [Nocardiopsaceae bacterium]|jgi:predicted ATPase|nr:AAA family ATPase [Nocardiopsaceae bacterium]